MCRTNTLLLTKHLMCTLHCHANNNSTKHSSHRSMYRSSSDSVLHMHEEV